MTSGDKKNSRRSAMKAGAGDLQGILSVIPDTRMERCKKHKLIDILVIALCGVIAGADTWQDVVDFGNEKLEWLSGFLEIPHGIPSHDTFARVFAMVDSRQLNVCFAQWTASVREKISREIVAIDGKTARRSHEAGKGIKALHQVSAWAQENGMVLGQIKTEEKSNEITAIPELLRGLNVHNCIVTIDAMGCQVNIAEKIVSGGGDYVLSLKGNQGTLHEDVKLFYEDARGHNFKETAHDYYETVEKGHGRIEERRYWISEEIGWLSPKKEWKQLRSIGCVEGKRIVNGQESVEQRYYLSSLSADAKEFARAARGHWSIENSCHWVLDMVFREDESRMRIGNSQANFSILRHMALNLLKSDKSSSGGIKRKRLKAGWSNDYLARLVGNLKDL
jgi:predicted transposase YbfD/YdcC